ncbi:hypothetical protein C5167_027759 [Papaver somniferum]|uniref:vinorine synthase-like n=1 Tax=Papaver somniferum TaxID=3469 RepID=UPI000E6F5B7A|nr:vinorine synthase-like [Papaver somniferum]RZC91695.1 hypothetical protein C5167_027759 [Papaver somniferum]
MSDVIMKIDIVSRESIRPSSPTPSHLNTYSLSLLDQLCPPLYVPLLLYYTKQLDSGTDCNLGDKESSSRCDVLKKSLAETLSKYYPLAGRIKDDVSVECNDEGVDFIEARVVGREVSQVIQLTDSVNIDIMEPFLPFEPYGESGSTFGLGLDLVSKALLKIQVNVFDCGGIIICAYIFHRIADGTTFVNFIKDWAATARGDGDSGFRVQGKPHYELFSLFPPRALLGFNVNEMIETEKGILTKRFVFKALNIAKLKKKCIHDAKEAYEGGEQEQQPPTRFEALTSLIWKCFMDVDRQTKARRHHEDVVSASVDAPTDDAVLRQVQHYGASFSINLRTRMNPPLPSNTFGNAVGLAIAQVSHNLDNNVDYAELVSKVKNAVDQIDSDHVRALQSTDALSNIEKMKPKLEKGTVLLHFTSRCRFPIYEAADFGWGKPTWASLSKLPTKNLVMFMDTSSGDGVEAYVSLKNEDMMEFERHQELLAFVA